MEMTFISRIENNTTKKTSGTKISIILFLCLGIFLTLASIALTVFGAFPCIFVKCNQSALRCVNYPFRAQCICDYGYQGNGKEYCDKCGVSYVKTNIRIVGGIHAAESSWPSAVIVNLKYKKDALIDGNKVKINKSIMCGGNLINRKTVLTAAHCIIESFHYDYQHKTYVIKIEPNEYYPTKESMYQVYLGVYNTSRLTLEDISPAKLYKVKRIIKHPAYDDFSVLNDIAIIQLASLIDLDKRVQLACLPNAKWSLNAYPRPNTTGYIIGWGRTFETGNLSDVLKNAVINVYDHKYCGFIAPEVNKNWNSQICADTLNATASSCRGDSGGGLFVIENYMNRTFYVLSGIISYSIGCARLLIPGVYTRVSYYLDWIHENSQF